MTSTPSPGMVAYDEEPARTTALLSRTKEYVAAGSAPQRFDGPTPPCWAPSACYFPSDLRSIGFVTDYDGVLYAHRLRIPGRPERLVVVEAASAGWNARGHWLVIDCVELRLATSSLGSRVEKVRLFSKGSAIVELPAGQRLRVLAGQPDAADWSHFTLAFDIGGVPGRIDGWARESETLLAVHGPGAWHQYPP